MITLVDGEDNDIDCDCNGNGYNNDVPFCQRDCCNWHYFLPPRLPFLSLSTNH